MPDPQYTLEAIRALSDAELANQSRDIMEDIRDNPGPQLDSMARRRARLGAFYKVADDDEQT